MTLGIGAPYIIIDLDWRWVYHITAIAAGCFLVGVFFFVPETRWSRTKAQMRMCFDFILSKSDTRC